MTHRIPDDDNPMTEPIPPTPEYRPAAYSEAVVRPPYLDEPEPASFPDDEVPQRHDGARTAMVAAGVLTAGALLALGGYALMSDGGSSPAPVAPVTTTVRSTTAHPPVTTVPPVEPTVPPVEPQEATQVPTVPPVTPETVTVQAPPPPIPSARELCVQGGNEWFEGMCQEPGSAKGDPPPVDAPDPGTSDAPDPGTSDAPDPGTSDAPDPGTSDAPDPGTGSGAAVDDSVTS